MLLLPEKTSPAARCFQESCEASHLRGKKRLPSTAIRVSFCTAEQATTKPWDSACPATADGCSGAPADRCTRGQAHFPQQHGCKKQVVGINPSLYRLCVPWVSIS